MAVVTSLETVPCPCCDGDGEYEVGPTNRGTWNLSPRYEMRRCELCKGAGSVPPEDAEEWREKQW